jgi:RNA polymerase sigma-70 factor (ECF subfamily)
MDDSADDEAGLVIRSRTGDRAAFEQLVRDTARGLFARIYLETADAHRAEDLVQETFLRAWTKLPSLSDPKTFRGWLNAIAHGVVVDSHKHDARKKRGRAETKTDEQTMLRMADDSAGPEEWAQRSEQRLAAVEALRSLPQEYQDVLSLRYLAGADYREIGKQLAISNGSLRGLLGRGLKLLREKMRDGT